MSMRQTDSTPVSTPVSVPTTTTQVHVILAGVKRQQASKADFQTTMNELAALAETLGWEVRGRLEQRREKLSFSTALGRGKLDELAELVRAIQAPAATSAVSDDEPTTEARRSRRERPIPRVLVLFNEPLSPMQFHNMEEHLGVEVLDRAGVILEIFRQQARTRESKLQVELARLHYLALRMRTKRGKDMDQQAAGIGAKGLGEAAHKLEKRWVRDRMAQLRRELAVIAKGRRLRCARRSDANNVALVGYTNAGKSSWMRALTGEDVWVQDRLFATLETTVRSLDTASPRDILLSDTVGFIEDLPHELVASFRATLEEARQASLLLHIVDASAPQVQRQIDVTTQTLRALEAAGIPCLLIFNKADLLDKEQRETLALLYPDAHFVSTHCAEDIDAMKTHITGFFAGQIVEEALFVPYARHHLMPQIYETMDVLSVSHEDDGSQLLVRAFSTAFAYIEEQLVPKAPALSIAG